MYIDLNNILSLLKNIIRCPSSAEYNILIRQHCFNRNSNELFTERAELVLEKYGMETIHELMKNPRSKKAWKKEVRKAQKLYWSQQCEEDIAKKSTLLPPITEKPDVTTT